MTKKVLYYTDSQDFGGAEQALLTLLSKLDRQHWRPAVAYQPEPGIAPFVKRVSELDIPVWTAPQLRGKRGVLKVPQLMRKLQTERPDVFHANLSHTFACRYALLAAALARVPAIVATEHLFVDVTLRRSILLKRLISVWVDRYIAVSHEMAGRLSQTFGFSTPKIQVVHNAFPLLPLKPFSHASLPAVFKEQTDRPIVLTTARLDKQKGHSHLLQAAALVPEVLLVFAGDGPERAALQAQVEKLGLSNRVVFLGYRDDVMDLLARCDVFVLPSLFEGCPLSLLEAMAAGKPIIASAIGGIDEIVINGVTGLLVPPENPSALAAAIRRLISDSHLAAKLSAAGRRRVQKEFSADLMIQRITKIYEEVLSCSESPYTPRRQAA